MRVVVQRSKKSNVYVDGKLVNEIDSGMVLLVSFTQGDTEDNILKMVKKIANLRIFDDEAGVMNKSILDVGGEILSISQFTLYANCRKGNRPSFIEAGAPDEANKLYEYIISEASKQVPVVEHGIFGADMKVSLINDGPFTIVLDSKEL